MAIVAHIIGSILIGADQMIGEFVAARIPHMRDKSFGPFTALGVVRRGYLREGYAADVCVFDRATVGTGPTRRVRDFPADAERLTAEEPTGVRHVLVNGTPIRIDESQLDSTHLRPGTHADIA